MTQPPGQDVPPALAAAQALLGYVEGDQFELDTGFHQIVYGTFMRSRETFGATYNLVAQGYPVQAAMLVRSLFEDMVVAHWVVLNREDPEWLVARFRRHAEAMALVQDRLQRETGCTSTVRWRTRRRCGQSRTRS